MQQVLEQDLDKLSRSRKEGPRTRGSRPGASGTPSLPATNNNSSRRSKAGTRSGPDSPASGAEPKEHHHDHEHEHEHLHLFADPSQFAPPSLRLRAKERGAEGPEMTRWTHREVLTQVEFNRRQKAKAKKLSETAEQIIKELAEEANNDLIKIN